MSVDVIRRQSFDRQPYRKSGSFPYPAFYSYRAVVLLDYAIAYAQPEAGPPARRLGSEKRVKDAVYDRFIYSGSGVTENHLYRIIRLFHRDSEFAPFRHGIDRIQHKVQENLLYLVRIYLQWRYGIDIRDKLDVLEPLVILYEIDRPVQNF